MKKFISFFSMLLLFVLGASAQVHEDLQGKAVTVGPALANFQTNTWYFLHQSRPNSEDKHSVVGELPQAGGYAYDNGVGKQAYKSGLDVIDNENGTPTSSAAKYMMRFLESGNQDGAYIIQFGTGNYLSATNTTDNGAHLVSTDNIYDACDLNIYNINGEEGHFGINCWNMGKRLDNNSVGGTLSWWGDGEITGLNGNNDWAIHEVIFAEVDAREMAFQEAMAIQTEYERLSAGFESGTEPGQYDAAALQALENAIEAIHSINDDMTADDIKQLTQNVIDAYEACVATRVYFTTPDGYYHIVSAMTWTKTETIPDVDEEGNPVLGEDGEQTSTTVTTHPTKAIYVDGTAAKWGNYEPDNCTFLWKFEETENHNFKVYNVAQEGGFNNIAQSANATMADTATVIRIVVLGKTEDGKTKIGFTGEKQTGAYQYAHCGGHGGGAGNGGNIVGWGVGDIGASEWVLEAVSAEDAAAIIEAYEPIKNHELLVEMYNEIKTDAKAKLEISKDIFTNLSEDTPLITDASQFASEYTTTDEQSKDGAPATEADVYGFLLDGNAGTYWHSKWENGNVAGGTHYLQVELPAGSESITNAAIKFTRRAVANDHITVWGIYGSNDATVAKAEWNELAVIETPFSSNTETIVSGVFPTGGYQYLRFYINNTVGSEITATRGYGHVSEFQLYPAEVSQRTPNQYAQLGDIVTNLENILAEQAELEADDVTPDEYNALKAAYDAFIAKFTDPTPLRNKIKEVEGIAAIIKIGNNPGEWSNAGPAEALTSAIEAATAYDLAAIYTPEKSEEWIATLTAAAEAVPAAANQIQEGKWYYYRFGTEDEYEENNWNLANGQASENEETGVVQPELFGKYMTVATKVVLEEETGVYEIQEIDAEEVCLGNAIHFLDKDMDITDEDLAKWRFISVGDTAYIIQNKGTGLFIKAAGTSGQAQLSIHPTLFAAPKAIGYGEVLTAARTLDGANNNNLHAQRDNNTLVTWQAAEPGTNSGLFIEEAEDVAEDYDGATFRIKALQGEISTYCYPVAVTATEEGAVLYNIALDGTEITLSALKDNTAQPGQPFVLIYGTPDQYNEEATEEDYEAITLTHGYDINKTALTVGSLVGTYNSVKIGAGKVVAEGNTFVITKKSATTAGANSAYLAPEEELDLDAELTITISGDIYDNIATALNTVAKTGYIYTLDGKVAGHGNINTIKQLGRGIYILNGAKVTVK